ncbi:hypothetical protein LTR36_001985 [Oleoguttula mirabilis]|uniref:tRNA dimethylallyltransferase n=1 Tax=Oleoguttula mirabilis TaxID=1507867 RepID=A0AAV9JM02_9PEZI|nr:hypothetical protein LTR36_001985 [Oleoguttula mirabilis]
MARKPPKEPLIAIIGATGTGKSQLAVSLAQRFNGEIINGDAMQLYAGLPIITNKVTAEEQQGIPHHLLGCIGLAEQTWVVGTFVRRALNVIDEIRARGKLPILVGGTHYYTQSLLFHDRLAAQERDEVNGDDQHDERAQWPILEQPTEVLLEELTKVDPAMADRWHPKDRRKIQRSLEIYLKTGLRASEVYAEQRLRKGVQTTGTGAVECEMMLNGPAMRSPTLLFWVSAETDVLRERLDGRVDKMLDTGLLDEVRTLNAYADAEALAGTPVDETRGIWVSIGYKEFKGYVHALESGGHTEKELEKMKADALERTQIATRQYAKRQVRWIRIKLLNALSEAGASDALYLLDGSEVANFGSSVVEPATELAKAFLEASPRPRPQEISPVAAELLRAKREYDISAQPDRWSKQHCDTCDVTCVIEEQWAQHVRSKAHRKLVSRRKKQVLDGSGGAV